MGETKTPSKSGVAVGFMLMMMMMTFPTHPCEREKRFFLLSEERTFALHPSSEEEAFGQWRSFPFSPAVQSRFCGQCWPFLRHGKTIYCYLHQSTIATRFTVCFSHFLAREEGPACHAALAPLGDAAKHHGRRGRARKLAEGE